VPLLFFKEKLPFFLYFMNIYKKIIFVSFLFLCLHSYGQEVPKDLVTRMATKIIEQYYPDSIYSVKSITKDSAKLIYIVNLQPEGWILVSTDMRTKPVIGFSFFGDFTEPNPDKNDSRFSWLQHYKNEIKEIIENKNATLNPEWKDIIKSKSVDAYLSGINVNNLIDVTWNQGRNWNLFCPVDSAGPGGHAYVGCVAVSMAQAMSVFKYPVKGTGTHTYFHKIYGSQFADFGNTTYMWDSMALDHADPYNALLLYHCAVSVDTDFGADGSSAQTGKSSFALKKYFKYSSNISCLQRDNYDDQEWKDLLNEQLLKGRPVIYSGNAADGDPGHAFNIDGVLSGKYFHINWGWGGIDNGYFILDALRPGSNDFSKNQSAVLGIQPYYYPTDIILSDSIVKIDTPVGTGIAAINIVDEANDNTYSLSLFCDSSLVNNTWIADYYIDGDSLRTNRIFSLDDQGPDTICIEVVDSFDHHLKKEKVLYVAEVSGANGVRNYKYSECTVFPNPVLNVLYFDRAAIQSKIIDRIRIYSVLGKLLMEKENYNPSHGIEVSGLSKGLYILEVTYDRNRICVVKFIKK